MEQYIEKDGKRLRLGYTTGSCAAAAAKAAAWMLLTGMRRERISLLTPKGIRLDLDVKEIRMTETAVSCAIEKDSGDDPDVTKGTLIFATVYHSGNEDILIDGGEGIGRVTKRGLDQLSAPSDDPGKRGGGLPAAGPSRRPVGCHFRARGRRAGEKNL
jgi:cobalt-precorrin-5B (C1)-methyltransferase